MAKKSFFKSEKDKLLWVRLNAERIQYSTKRINNVDVPVGKIGEPNSCMQVSMNQLIYDEAYRDKPRFSFEELVMSHDELFNLDQKRNKKVLETLFADNCCTDDSDEFNPGI